MRPVIDDLAPWQRAVLAGLSAAVVLAAVVLLIVAATRSDGSPSTTTAAAAPTTSRTVPETTRAPTTTAPGTTTSTVTTTSTTTTVPTTTTAPPGASLVLLPDGIGPFPFGVAASDAVAGIRDLLGPPDLDTGWVPVEQIGACIGSTVRFVRWGSLQVFLTDGPSDWAPAETRHLAAYDHAVALGDPVHDLRTGDGIALGTPVGDVRAILGADAVTGEEGFAPVFTLDPPGPGYQWGWLGGLEAGDVVESISGGFSCAD